MILSCVKRVRDRLGYSLGASLIAQVLHGSKGQRIVQLGLDELSTYGLLPHTSQAKIRETIEFLEGSGYLTTDPRYSALHLTEQAGNVLFRGEKVSMPVKAEPAAPERTFKKSKPQDAAPADEGLFAALKDTRNQLAREENVPAYIIFSNAALRDMADKAPRTPADFLEVSGVGQVKAARYGKIFLDAIAAYYEETT